MKQSVILAGVLLTCSNLSFAYDDRDKVCELEYKSVNVYYGNATCSVYAQNIYTGGIRLFNLTDHFPESNNNNQYEMIAKIVGHEWKQKSKVGARPLPPVSALECLARIPRHVRNEPVESCTWVPREPFITFAKYEFGNCSNYTRRGAIDWQHLPNIKKYQLFTTSDIKVYEGTQTFATYNSSTPGIKQFKVRAIDNNGNVGSFAYVNANVPACTPDGGVEPF